MKSLGPAKLRIRALMNYRNHLEDLYMTPNERQKEADKFADELNAHLLEKPG